MGKRVELSESGQQLDNRLGGKLLELMKMYVNMIICVELIPMYFIVC